VQAKDSSGAIIIPKVRMDGPRGESLLFGVPHGMKALHIEATHIPAGVVVISARDAGGRGLGNFAAGLAGPVEIWLRPGWYQETNCDLQWTHNVSLRGTSSHREDTVLDCKGQRRHMEFQGVSVVGRLSNLMLVNGFAREDGGCILVTDASLHLESVSFHNCISAGSSEASRVWKRGRGFGGAVAMVSSACKDDHSWRDSEGLGCDAYMPMVMDFLIVPFNPGPSQTPDPAPALARNRCARAKTLANADGADASTACCSCKWVTAQQNLYSTKCLVTSDDGETHSQQTCAEPGDQCVTATSAAMTVYYCSTPAAAKGFDCATAPGTAKAFEMNFTYSCCTAVDGVACNDPQQNVPSSRRSESMECLQTTSGLNAEPSTCLNPSDKCVAMTIVPVDADITIYFCESSAVYFGLNQSPCSALSLSLPPTLPAMLGDRVQYAGYEWIPTCCEGFMCNNPNKPTGFLRLPGSSLTMVNVKISSCTAKIGGGAVAVVSEGPRSNVGTVNITKTVISHCAAALGGGGVLILSMLNGMVGAIDLSHSVVSDCSAAPESGSPGQAFAGGIGVIALSESMIDTVDFAELTVSRCNTTAGAGGMLFWAEERSAVGSVQVHRSKVESCNSLSAGGGVLGSNNGGKFTGSILLEGLVFQDCHALATPFYSGDFESKFAYLSGALRGLFYPNIGGLALFGQVGGAIEISNTSFHRCSALSINGWGGGLLLGALAYGLEAARILLKGVLVEHCASMLGGGIFLLTARTPVSIEDTVIRKNNASFGGGLAVWPGPPIRVGPNVSILSNTAFAGGGGVALYSSRMTMGAYGNSLGVEVKGNFAMGELNISESGWIKKIQNPAVMSSSLSFSGQGGGILVLSNTDSGPSHLELLPGVSIVGNTAGCGGGIALATSQPVLANSPRSTLTASGSTAAPVIIADNTAVAKGDAINFKLIVNSFKIAGGDPDVPWGDGGGLWAIDSSSITFKSEVKVRGNHAKRGGGISLNLASTLVTDGAVFSQNVATTYGGAVSSLLGVSISATQTQFSQNSAGNFGGGLATDFDSRATLTDCALEQNVAGSGGGGLLSTGDSSITLVMCPLVGNQAQKDGGGALVAGSATLTAVGGLIASNFVGGDGGGLAVVESASFSAEGTEPLEFRNNTARQNGGAAMFSSEGGVTLSSQMLSIKYNSATRGGGICFLSKLELMGSAATQIQSNVASGMGGGLFGYGTFVATKSSTLLPV
jgi:predicted outer membrane repeat protein